MKANKALLTLLAMIAGLVAAGGTELVPLPGVLGDLAVGVVGVVGLGLGAIGRALIAVAAPLGAISRVLAVPASLALIGWLIVRELRGPADRSSD